jgi:hypothetical protein
MSRIAATLKPMSTTSIALELEDAWAHALPCREAADRDSLLKELHRPLQTARHIIGTSEGAC